MSSMKIKLEKGMYIRTREGIRKITDVWEDMYELNRDLHNRYPEGHCLFKEDIDEVLLAEPSFDIIDVIEPGDLVNDMYVETNNGVELTTDQIDYASSGLGHVEYETIYMTSIEKVITKEQLAAMVYEVK